jgi:putative PIN family toxin of toxin-antitoxin system
MKRKRKLRFVFDTNVLVSSAITPGGVASRAFEEATRRGFFLHTEETFSELKAVLYRPQFDLYLPERERQNYLIAFLRHSYRIIASEFFTVCADPDDDMFIDAAVGGQAQYLVTGNLKDFPPSPFRNIHIVTPAQFLRML